MKEIIGKFYEANNGNKIEAVFVPPNEKDITLCYNHTQKTSCWLSNKDINRMKDWVEQIEVTGYINAYEGHTSSILHKTKDEADKCALPGRLACIRVYGTSKP